MSASTSEGQTVSRAPSLRGDILSAYVATGAKLGSWVIVSALVFRVLGPAQFAILALIRGTIGLLNYISLGLAPALIHEASKASSAGPLSALPMSHGNTLSYEVPKRLELTLSTIYANSLLIASILFALGVAASGLFAVQFERLFRVPSNLSGLSVVVCFIGIGTLLRLMGDVPGAVLQVRSRIVQDNVFVAIGDVVWTAFVILVCMSRNHEDALVKIAWWYAISGTIAFMLRLNRAGREANMRWPDPALWNMAIIRRLLSFGVLVVLAQLADYLYAPTDYILIDHLLSPLDIASYAPALQIDGALLVLVSGLSAVLLPRAAVAHASGERKTVQRYYVIGTISSFALLAPVSLVVWLVSPWIFRLWLGNPMVETQRILPVLLICTTLGGSSMVGRSVLLAVGKVRPFTVAVLIAGVTNVVFSYVFVTRFGWGLRGIVLGTVVAVVGRCAIWMPWYVMRVLKSDVTIESVQVIEPAV